LPAGHSRMLLPRRHGWVYPRQSLGPVCLNSESSWLWASLGWASPTHSRRASAAAIRQLPDYRCASDCHLWNRRKHRHPRSRDKRRRLLKQLAKTPRCKRNAEGRRRKLAVGNAIGDDLDGEPFSIADRLIPSPAITHHSWKLKSF